LQGSRYVSSSPGEDLQNTKPQEEAEKFHVFSPLAGNSHQIYQEMDGLAELCIQVTVRAA